MSSNEGTANQMDPSANEVPAQEETSFAVIDPGFAAENSGAVIDPGGA